MAKKNKVFNFQRGSNGRDKGTTTYTVKERTKKGTKAFNVRCNGESSKVCKIIEDDIDALKSGIETSGQQADEKAKRRRRKK